MVGKWREAKRKGGDEAKRVWERKNWLLPFSFY